MRTDENSKKKANKQTKKQARDTKIVLQKFTKKLSTIRALSRGCRFCNFL